MIPQNKLKTPQKMQNTTEDIRHYGAKMPQKTPHKMRDITEDKTPQKIQATAEDNPPWKT